MRYKCIVVSLSHTHKEFRLQTIPEKKLHRPIIIRTHSRTFTLREENTYTKTSLLGEPVNEQKERAAAHDCCKDNGVLALLASNRTHDVIEDRKLGAYRIDLAMNVREETSLLHDAAHRCLGAPNNLHRDTDNHR